MAARRQKQGDPEEMDLEELDALLMERNNERDTLQQDIRDLRAVRDRKALAERARSRVAGLSAVERAAMMQELSLAAADGGATTRGE